MSAVTTGAGPVVEVVESDGGPPAVAVIDGLEMADRVDMLHADGGDGFAVVAGVRCSHQGAAWALVSGPAAAAPGAPMNSMSWAPLLLVVSGHAVRPTGPR